MSIESELYNLKMKILRSKHISDQLREELANDVFEIESSIASKKNESLHFVNDMFISTDYLMVLHPELNREEAESLKEYANSNTINYKECYSDGSIIYPRWKEVNNR